MLFGCFCIELFVGFVGDDVEDEDIVVVVVCEFEEEIGYCVGVM